MTILIDPVPWPPSGEDDLDSLHVEITERERILGAIREECATEDLSPADPADLPRYGRFVQGEEDPTIRRFLVAPPGSRWTTILLSAPDWDHDWCPRLVRRLGCRAAYLMLHDGDVFTLHLHGPGGLVAAHVTSPVHFDRPSEERSPALRRALESFAGRPTGAAEIEEAISPRGAIDVDGRLAHGRTARLLGIEPRELGAYRHALRQDGLRPREELAAWTQLAFVLHA